MFTCTDVSCLKNAMYTSDRCAIHYLNRVIEAVMAVATCKASGGRSIGAGHECICNHKLKHEGKHGCECGAIWGKE